MSGPWRRYPRDGIEPPDYQRYNGGGPGQTPRPETARVPWGVSDVVAAAGLNIAGVAAVLALVLTAESVREGKEAQTIAGAAIGTVLALAGALTIARVARLKLIPVLIAIFIGGAIGLVVTTAGGGTLEENDGEIAGVPVTIVLFAILEGIFMSTAWLFARTKYGVGLPSLGLVSARGYLPYAIAAGYWVIALGAVLAWTLTIQALGIDALLLPESAEDVLDLAGGSVAIAIVLVGLWGPLAEEIFFRGFLLNGLRSRFGVVSSILISSAVFGAFHIAPGAIVPTFLLGLMLGWVYTRSGSLWPAVFAHGLHNTVAILVASSNLDL